ncbi:MAG TPA: hypothetical protein VFL27_09895, partial [Candidatus Dormibacteraeota bacterium]|nr:hypothetical protein [Candidatus Dormibacteraeota bacterium]
PRASIGAYQKMIEADYKSAAVVWNSHCDIGFHTGCGTDAARAIPVIQGWLDDLNRTATPPRFAFVDAELRDQLTQNLSAEQDLVAAAEADDGTAMDTAYIVSVYAINWTGVIVPAILGSRQVNAALYASSVSEHRADLDFCVLTCVLLITQQDCTLGNIEHPCYDLIGDVAVRFTNFEAKLVQEAAPDSLATRDSQLQADLVQANRILLTWRRAIGASDQAAVDAGVGQIKAIILKIDRDADSIAQVVGP